MPPKTSSRNKSKAKAGGSNNPGVDSENQSIFQDIDAADLVDEFESLFGSEDDQVVTVELRRTLPDYIISRRGENIPAKGFLENLPGGLTSYYSYIKDKYGGGTYQAHRKVNNRYQGGKQIEIAGVAKMPIDDNADGPEAAAAPIAGQVEGVELGGSDEDFKKRLNRIAEIKATMKMLNSAGDSGSEANKQLIELNQQLINIALKNANGPNPLEQMTTFADMMKVAREIGGDSGSVGAGWPDIIKESLATVGKMMQAGGARQPRNNGPGRLPAADGNNNQEGKDQHMDLQTIAGTAIGNIVAAFRLDKEPDRVVRMLDAMMPLEKSDRVKLREFRDVAADLAETQASEIIDDFETPEVRKKFDKYFEEIFDKFTDADRVPFSFGGK